MRAQHRAAAMRRVARKFTETLQPQLASFRDTGFMEPSLAREVQPLTLLGASSRRVEQAHAQIKRSKLMNPGLPGKVCADLRASETVALLEDPAAYAFLA
eukprot:11591664-Alexandrium_andersonii.AAC.1